MPLDRDLLLIYAAAFLRSLGIGLSGVILGIYLSRTGLSASQIGLVIASGMGGVAVATLVAGLRADRIGRRSTLVAVSLLAALGGLGLALISDFPAILLLAFAGMLNGMGRDRGALFALDQAILPEASSEERRTWALAWYNLVLDAGHAVGALAGAFPFLLRRFLEIDPILSYQLSFGLYGFLNLLSALTYSLLSRRVEILREERKYGTGPARVSPQSKRIITRLAALFAIDSLGGGLLSGALVAYWFFRRFGVSEESLGPLFFVIRVLNALSYLGAAWLARRIGLLNTMVFTHIPSSLFLMAVPFAPSFGWAVALFLARELLVEMDVPTRQSYIVAVVQPKERTFASSVTNLTRNIAWATSPSFAGYLMQQVNLAAPLFAGGGIKVAYDIILFLAFRGLKPPEEQAAIGPIPGVSGAKNP